MKTSTTDCIAITDNDNHAVEIGKAVVEALLADLVITEVRLETRTDFQYVVISALCMDLA